MCGICGAINLTGTPLDIEILKRMPQALIHRGPDDEGTYLEKEIFLGARRLAIIDLEKGHQPLHNEDESVWLVFNGEIYNYKELRQGLEARGHRFYTFSDTETIVHLYEEYGRDCVEQLNGMFAFAVWDKNKKTLFLARDRLGIKPLYYSHSNKNFVFGSEIKSLLVEPQISRSVDIAALDTYLTCQYILSPDTIFKEIKKLPPGHTLTYTNGVISISRYWDIPLEHCREKSDECYIEKILDLLRDSIRLRLRSDVPFGAFLSGGIDSSAVVGLMAGLMDKPVRTFSMGFDEPSFSELKYARLISDCFGTTHHEFIVTPPDVTQILSKIIWHFDEPFGDSSSIPTFMVSQLAKEKVKMVLSGDGGDELFAGYERYLAAKFMKHYLNIPGGIREKIISPAVKLLPEGSAIHDFRRELRKFILSGHAAGNKPPSPDEIYAGWMSIFNSPMKESLYSAELKSALRDVTDNPLLAYFQKAGRRDYLNRFLYVDATTYLPEDLLTKVDRMSMANSLEVRIPFLDYRLVEFAFGIPSHLKLKGTTPKYILKKALYKLVPKQILRHRKHGFGVPIGNWLRAELRDWSRDILLDERALKRGYFNKDFLEQLLGEHQRGLRDHSHRIWSLLVLELWHCNYID
jgi:asparagine synthase (glutamine-hydrolysing)